VRRLHRLGPVLLFFNLMRLTGEEGLRKRAAMLEAAVLANEPQELKSVTMPALPDIGRIPLVGRKVEECLVSHVGYPVQFVGIRSSFVHMRLLFDLRGLPKPLRRYLPLFQEMITETDLRVPGRPIVPYTDVLKRLTEDVCLFRLFRR